MVCPMRFVLVGISICLAWLAAWRCMAEPEQQGGQQGSTQQKRWRWQEAGSTLLDMFTGKYLYNYLCQRPPGGAVKAR